MKVFTLAMIAAATSAVQIQQESSYNLYWELADRNKPPIWSVVKRGDVRDFADDNVEKAMRRNPSSGTWPIATIPEPAPPKPEDLPPFWFKQEWERVVQKGNSAFNDVQVDKALAKIPEPIVVDGKIKSG